MYWLGPVDFLRFPAMKLLLIVIGPKNNHQRQMQISQSQHFPSIQSVTVPRFFSGTGTCTFFWDQFYPVPVPVPSKKEQNSHETEMSHSASILCTFHLYFLLCAFVFGPKIALLLQNSQRQHFLSQSFCFSFNIWGILVRVM